MPTNSCSWDACLPNQRFRLGEPDSVLGKATSLFCEGVALFEADVPVDVSLKYNMANYTAEVVLLLDGTEGTADLVHTLDQYRVAKTALERTYTFDPTSKVYKTVIIGVQRLQYLVDGNSYEDEPQRVSSMSSNIFTWYSQQ